MLVPVLVRLLALGVPLLVPLLVLVLPVAGALVNRFRVRLCAGSGAVAGAGAG